MNCKFIEAKIIKFTIVLFVGLTELSLLTPITIYFLNNKFANIKNPSSFYILLILN